MLFRSVGAARTKYLAKVASAVAKPDGLLVVDPGAERDFLHPLPVERLWGVGPVTAEAILAWRTEHGTFTSVDELLEVDGIGEATLADIAPHVTL